MVWRIILSFFLVCMLIIGYAQPHARITGMADTSFTIEKEYNNLKKEYPFIQPARIQGNNNVKITRNQVYCTRNQPMRIDVFQPVSQKKSAPAIIIIHGGGWRSGNKEQHHALAEQLALRGYVCFTPAYRLSTEALYPAAVQDLKSALRWITANANRFGVDTSRLVVAGFSAGGQLASLLGATWHKRGWNFNPCVRGKDPTIQAVINIDGILAFIHPESGEGNDNNKLSAATKWFGHSKNEKPGLWIDASALNHISSFNPPALFLNSSVDRMHAGRDDFIKILNGYGIYSEVKNFRGAPHSFPLFHPWFDSTVVYMDHFLQKVFSTRNASTTIIVSKDGSGNYTTVQEAFNAIPPGNKEPFTVYVRNGVYREKVFLDSSKINVTLIGENAFETIISFDDHSGKITAEGDTINTYTSQTFHIAAGDFTARNIGFENKAGFHAGQAVAIRADGDRIRFFNCRFTGNQDVLFTPTPGSRQYFEDCYIEGTTDFIFGASTAWFEHCHIHSKKNSHVTAAATPKESAYGYVFYNCILTGNTSLGNVSLGRPWRPYAHVAYINSYIGAHIKAEGWSDWNNNGNIRSSTFVEYGNYGPSAWNDKRLPGVRSLTSEEVKYYSLLQVLAGWNPKFQHP